MRIYNYEEVLRRSLMRGSRMRLRRSVTTGAMLALAGALVSTAHAGAAGQPVESISPGDPYASCTIGGSGTTVSAPSTEVEPWVATDPRNPGHVIGVYQQDRWSGAGGARGLAASYSSDGRHFTHIPLPFSRCAPGGLPYERASDAWVSFGPDGTAYVSALNFDVNDANNGVAAATSYNGGRTWKHVTQLIAETSAEFADDKNSVTADPNHAGVAYQVWDRIDQIASGPGAIYNGPAFISTTRDHGRTWSTPRVFVDTSVIPNSQTLGNVIVPDARRHALYDFFEWQTYSDTTANTVTDLHFALVKSTDEGRTWSKPTKIANDSSTLEVDPNAPNDPAKALRAGNNLISAAIDPQTGELYAAYEGTDFSGGAFNQIELVHSTDHGATWSAPARISQVPNTPAFTPSIAVDTNGTVALTYYDLRYLQPGDTTTLPTAAWYLTFPRGGEAFPSERQISAVFDWLQAPFATWGHFLGDYASVAALGHEQFRPLFAESFAIPGNTTDVYSNVFGSGFAPTTPKAAPVTPGATTAPHLSAHRTRH